MGYCDRVEFCTLKGKTLSSVEKNGSESIIFNVNDKEKYILYHDQDCCEDVYIEDVCGDFEDIVNSEILVAEEVSSGTDPDGAIIEDNQYRESFTWTFYKISTIKGSVTLRWYGESNGYYSEGVDFEKINQKGEQ